LADPAGDLERRRILLDQVTTIFAYSEHDIRRVYRLSFDRVPRPKCLLKPPHGRYSRLYAEPPLLGSLSRQQLYTFVIIATIKRWPVLRRRGGHRDCGMRTNRQFFGSVRPTSECKQAQQCPPFGHKRTLRRVSLMFALPDIRERGCKVFTCGVMPTNKRHEQGEGR
jgi:hypothetical protein